MTWVYYIIIGAVAGWLAGQIMKGEGFGLFGNILVGIVGGVIGGWLFGALNISAGGGIIGSLFTAVVGAIVLVFIAGFVKRSS
ncbi:MAG: GlsB/YeaQ/YmgE family stress response membrane protein [Saprospiraceae bacterium]|nr:GlsB/YeaQ/YmgE family stress response membrane protein [Saprospiraceae bacterium]